MIIRGLAIYIVLFFLVSFSFDLLAKPVYQKIETNRFAKIEEQIKEGNIAQAQEDLNKQAESERKRELANLIYKIDTDLLFARDYYEQSGNTAEAELISQVINSYETPKQMLEVVQYLLEIGEDRYAKMLFERAERIASDYKGVKEIAKYFESWKEVKNYLLSG